MDWKKFLFSILALALWFITVNGLKHKHKHFIVGGQQTDIIQFPWQISVAFNGFVTCGGSIVSEKYILTAGHCIARGAIPTNSASKFTVLYGTSKPRIDGCVAKVRKITRHPNYVVFSGKVPESDAAILELKKAIMFSPSAQSVTLSLTQPRKGQSCVITGWGAVGQGNHEMPSILLRTDVVIVDQEECAFHYSYLKYPITENMFCAAAAGKDACQGDSGGPITVDNKQIGVVSWGAGCANDFFPGVYTRIVNFKEFIDQATNNTVTWS